MSTAIQPQTAPTADPQEVFTGEQRVLLHGISWSTYEGLVHDMTSGGPRLIYDNGSLEIVAPSYSHEVLKRLLGKVVEILADQFELPLQEGGSTTFQRPELNRGVEPDECYWIANAPALAGKREIDLDVDPPPDLVVEVDITSFSIDKLDIYAPLRVPEVWRFDGRTLSVYVLQSDGSYRESPHSQCFPTVPLPSVVQLLEGWPELDHASFAREFRKWARENLAHE